MTDTAGSSDLVFGFFWLLGYPFSPRLAAAGEVRFWRVDRDADYGPLAELASNRVSTKRMSHHAGEHRPLNQRATEFGADLESLLATLDIDNDV